MTPRHVFDPITKRKVRVRPIRVVCGNYPKTRKKRNA